MRVLHAAYQRHFSPGISSQMHAEQQAADSQGIAWDSRLFTSRRAVSTDVVDLGASGRGAGKKSFYRWLREASAQYDVIVLRHIPADPLELQFVRNAKVPIFSVHHTLELPELLSTLSVRSVAKAAAEAVLAPKVLRLCRGVIGVTEEIAEYERGRSKIVGGNFLVYPNGIKLAQEEAPVDGRSDDVPRIIFVSSYFQPWQGLDKLIQAARLSGENFVIDIVGNVAKEDAKALSGDKRFVVHGLLGEAETNALSARSWLALSSFALERKRMKQACTLKVRQYLSQGVAVYASHEDVFPVDFPYFHNGPCDIASIIQFARTMRQVSRDQVRLRAAEYIDKARIVRRLYENLMQVVW